MNRICSNHYHYVLGNPKKHGGVGLAKSYPEGLSKRQELARLGDGQDVYPGLQSGGPVDDHHNALPPVCGDTHPRAGQDVYPGPRNGQIAATDGEIDALVYDLYRLTEDEIRIVEGGQ